MRIGIDAREIQNGVYTGIGGPLFNFIHYFSQLKTDDHCVLFSAKKIPFEFGTKVTNVVMTEFLTQIWDQVQLTQAIQKEHIDLFFSPYYKVPLFAKCKVVSAILDLMYLNCSLYKKSLNPLTKAYYLNVGKKFVNRSNSILTCSQHSKKDIVQAFGVAEEKIRIIPLSICNSYKIKPNQQEINETLDHFSIDSKYILYLGNFKPHKNVSSLINAFTKVALTATDLKLVLAGPKTHCYHNLLELVDKLSLTKKVIFTGKISDKHTSKLLYSGAEVFVMPTLYEGFGLPPLEAMACHTPVVTSNCTSVPEVVQGAGFLVDPLDINQLADSILRILNNPELRDNLIEKGLAQVENYYEDKIVEATYNYFKEVYTQTVS